MGRGPVVHCFVSEICHRSARLSKFHLRILRIVRDSLWVERWRLEFIYKVWIEEFGLDYVNSIANNDPPSDLAAMAGQETEYACSAQSTPNTNDAVACDVSEQRAYRAHWHVPPRLLWRHVIGVKFEGAAAGRDVHLVCRDVPGPDSGVQLPSDVEGDNDRTCEVALEE